MAVDVGDFNDKLQDDSERFQSRTMNEENYTAWANKSQAESASPAKGLAARYGLDEDDLESYSDEHSARLEEAVESGEYEAGLQSFADKYDGDAAEGWRETFVEGLNKYD